MNALHNYMKILFADCLELSVNKNHDYAGDGDPLRNFKKSPEFGVPVPAGIMVRLSDKWSRLEGFFANDGKLSVKGETVLDTLMDIINYTAILGFAMRSTPESFEEGTQGDGSFEPSILLQTIPFPLGTKFDWDHPGKGGEPVEQYMDQVYAANDKMPVTTAERESYKHQPEHRTLDELDEATTEVLNYQSDLAAMDHVLGVRVSNVAKTKQMIEDSYKDSPKVPSAYEEWDAKQKQIKLDFLEQFDRPGGEE